ncbi:MAG: hypothetical protein IJV38_08100 [Prevotella sp.]|nr:hypothetical protein [Prevotella sp.]
MAVKRSNIKHVFYHLRKNGYNKAQREMVKSLPGVMNKVHQLIRDKMAELKKSDMTGNYINSFGIALYRNGQFVACATTNDIEGEEPYQVTLASGDIFQKGRSRYDGSFQKKTFKAPEGSMRRILANEEVVRWLRRYRPRVSKSQESLAYRIVTVVDYAKMLGGNKVLLQLADDVEGRGGDIREFRFA